MQNRGVLSSIIFALVLGAVLLVGALFIPWQRVNWGKIEFLPASTITVSGEAKQQEASQIARFSAGVTVTNQDKQTAINEVNQKMEGVLQAVKDFGIPEEDIQTQRVSTYEGEDWETKVKEWTANNSISITLREVSQASDLVDMLNQTEATGVSGPSFSLDDTQAAEVDLLAEAIANAQEKAEKIAQSSGRRLGKIVTVTEGAVSSVYPLRATMEIGVGGGAPIEPGTETVSKTVTVVFELK